MISTLSLWPSWYKKLLNCNPIFYTHAKYLKMQYTITTMINLTKPICNFSQLKLSEYNDNEVEPASVFCEDYVDSYNLHQDKLLHYYSLRFILPEKTNLYK